MKKAILLLLIGLLLNCGSGSENNPSREDNLNDNIQSQSSQGGSFSINGKIQKGPFIQGTNIVIRELNAQLAQTGISFSTVTENNTGFFRANMEMSTPFAEVIATGHYFNEITGEISNSPLTLRAIVNLSDSPVVNVNVLTNMTRGRIYELVRNGESINDAKTQAEQELGRFFKFDTNSIIEYQTLDISEAGERNAALLAVSAMTQLNHSVGELQAFLSQIDTDLQNNGQIDSEEIINKITQNSTNINLTEVRENLESRFQEIDSVAQIPSFENFIDSDGNGEINASTNKRLVVSSSRESDELGEGSKISISVRYEGPRPTEDLIVTVDNNLPGDIRVLPNSLVFTPENFSDPQEVRVIFNNRFGNDRNDKNLVLQFESDQTDTVLLSYSLSEGPSFNVNLPENNIITDEAPISITVNLLEYRILDEEADVEFTLNTNNPLISEIYPQSFTLANRHLKKSKEILIIPNRNLPHLNNETIEFTLSSTSHDNAVPVNFSLTFNQFEEPEFSFVPNLAIRNITDNFHLDYNNNAIIDSNNRILFPVNRNDDGNQNDQSILAISNNDHEILTGINSNGYRDGNRNIAGFHNIDKLKNMGDNLLYAIDYNPDVDQSTIRSIDLDGNVETIYTSPDKDLRSCGVLYIGNEKLYISCRKSGPIGRCPVNLYLLDLNQNEGLSELRNQDDNPICSNLNFGRALLYQNNFIYYLESDFDSDNYHVKKITINNINPRIINIVDDPVLTLGVRINEFAIDNNENLYLLKYGDLNLYKFNSNGNLLQIFENALHWSKNNQYNNFNLNINSDNEIILTNHVEETDFNRTLYRFSFERNN